MRSLITPVAASFLSILLASAPFSAIVRGALTHKNAGHIGMTEASPYLPCLSYFAQATVSTHTLLPCGRSVFSVHPNI
jgi:hypothetical protein